MTGHARIFLFFGIMLAVCVHGQTASAQATRTWVSGVGDDANPCSRTAPCKTFAGAISKTAAGGEINCIDAGGYGAVTIVKAMTIDCANVEAGVVVAGTNGVIVNAGANDIVVLRGIDFMGTISVPGLNGVRFDAGAALHIEKCLIREFLAAGTNGFGILFQPSGASKLFVSNTTLSNNGTGATGGAIRIKATGAGSVRASLTNVLMHNNVTGLSVDGTGTTGRSDVNLTNSVSSGATATGVSAVTPGSGGGVIALIIDRSSIANNVTGVSSTGPLSNVILASSTVTGNTTGLTISGGAIFSYKNNNINGNLTDGAPSAILAQN